MPNKKTAKKISHTRAAQVTPAQPSYTATSSADLASALSQSAASTQQQSYQQPMAQDSKYSFTSFLEFIANNFTILFLIILFFMGGFFAGSTWQENRSLKAGGTGTVVNNPSAVGEQPPAGDITQVRPVEDDEIRGNKNAKVVLVEYSDYECPFCARFHPTMQAIMEEYGDKVAWVYRHYPLAFHPNAQKAAEGALCVRKLAGSDAYWKYTDALFEEQDALEGRLNPDSKDNAARVAGVNMTAFASCVESGEMADAVLADMTNGQAAGVNGTPGTIVIVDGEPMESIPGAVPLDQTKQIIEKYL